MSQANTAEAKIRAETDVVYQAVKLFIEGVQVPFMGINVTSAMGQLPQASISIPVQVGLPEISRFYNPKVHIFFTDPQDDTEKLLFSGIVTGSSYDKTGDGNSGITFSCIHRYQFMSECTVDYTKWEQISSNPQASGEVGMHGAVGAKNAIALALVGCINNDALKGPALEVTPENVAADKANNTSKVQPYARPVYLDNYKYRLMGIPGVLLNLWQQQKQFAYMIPDESEATLKIFIPLIEGGLKFFQRMTGHFYLENLIELDRIDPCPGSPSTDGANKPRVVSPSTRVFLRSSIQTDINVELANSVLQFSGELTDLLTIYGKFLGSIEYEMQILASPAEAPLDPRLDSDGELAYGDTTYATDVIVKPELPFYYSPLCNVVYPNMITRISVTQDDYNIPTRIVIRNNDVQTQNDSDPNTYFRAPASIREAIASHKGFKEQVFGTGASETTQTVVNGNLMDTLSSSHNIIGLYEQGRIPKIEKAWMPRWLSIYSQSQFKDKNGGEGWPDVGTNDYKYLQALEKGWKLRYGAAASNLNPWTQTSGLRAYQRLLIAAADYKYAMTIARSRAGQVGMIFNPYIVPGYPMDVLDSTPNHPSYHGYCTSVTHSITANSISTTASFVSAMTYTELANYYSPPVHPWLQCVLDFAEQQTIIANETGKQTADKFYTGALNIGAAGPDMLYDFNTGVVLPVKRLSRGLIPSTMESSKARNGGELNPMLTGQGNVKLAFRPIETRQGIEQRESLTFIDITPGNYNPNAIKVANSTLEDAKDYLEPGQSQWLQYTPKFTDPNKA